MRKVLIICSIVGLLYSCMASSQQYIETDKITLSIVNGYIDQHGVYLIEKPEFVELKIEAKFEGIARLSVKDISSGEYVCDESIPASPSNIASFNMSPEKNVKNLGFRIRLPCAAYHNALVMQLKVDTTDGKYRRDFKIPIKLSIENPYGK